MKVTFKDWMALYELRVINNLSSVGVYYLKKYTKKAVTYSQHGDHVRFLNMHSRVIKLDKIHNSLVRRGEEIIEKQRQKGFNV